MFLRISVVDDDKSLNTIDINIDHIVYCGKENSLCIYDHDLSIYYIKLDLIYYFAIIGSDDAGVGYKCYNDLDLAFRDLGFQEVEDEFT